MRINRQRVVAYALILLSASLFWSLWNDQFPATSLTGLKMAFACAVCLVVLVTGAIVFLTSFDQGRTRAWLRLDWFVPALRKLNVGQLHSSSLIGRWLRRITPAFLQSNHQTKRRGLFRVGLRRLGISWLASPVRRIVQGICLLMFLTLFLIVCWPYSSRPPEPVRQSTGRVFLGLDQTAGDFIFQAEQAAHAQAGSWHPQVGEKLFLSSGSASGPKSNVIGEFTVVAPHDAELRLHPQSELTPAEFDLFLTGSGTFAFHETDPNTWPSYYADNLASKEFIPAEIFLLIDPLVSLSTAIAARSWVWSLECAAIILLVCVLIPRGFCGYLCPLGTTIDLFDWAVARRVKNLNVPDDGWWVHIKYYLLAGTLVAAVCGVLASGFLAAIPVITRGMLFIVDPFQTGLARGWHLIPPMNAGHLVSIVLFAGVLSLGFLKPRFWCKYVCPSGAVFSLGNLFRITERKVESSCIHCNKCIEICPFDAIKPDFTTRTTDCTMCQSCGGVCPTHAIKFVERWNGVELKIANDIPTHETSIGRRGFLSLAAGSTAAVVGGVGVATATKAFGANLSDPNAFRPVRPPGSVPEQKFLEMCIRCGECFKACPNNVLQSEGFQQGFEGLWTPMVNADWAGCESSCNACGQVCPTGAIRALPLEEKRVARMGLAIVNENSCLPFAEKQACDLCVQECISAGYNAIEYKQVGTKSDESGLPIDGSGFLAPVVLEDKCVGCGLCQTRCYAINVKEYHFLKESAIIVEAGEGKEDRLMEGSYLQLRASEAQQSSAGRSSTSTDDYYVPDSHEATQSEKPSEQPEVNDPFGVGPFKVNDKTDLDQSPF